MTATLSFTPSTAEAADEIRNRSPSRTFFSALSRTSDLAGRDAFLDRGLDARLLLLDAADRDALFPVADV